VSSGSGVAVPALRTAREEAHRMDKMDLMQINGYGLTLMTLDADLEVSMPALGSFRRGFLSSLQVAASHSKGADIRQDGVWTGSRKDDFGSWYPSITKV